jgi:hypothetical protein
MITKKFKNYNDMEGGQLSLGYYNGLPFLSISPIFEAHKGRNIDETPIQKGEKIFNHDAKVFFQLDIGDLIKIEQGLELLDSEEIEAFSLSHVSPFDDSKKVLEIATTKSGMVLKMTNKFKAKNGEDKVTKMKFNFSCMDKRLSFFTVLVKGVAQKFPIDIFYLEFVNFIKESKAVALGIATPTQTKDEMRSLDDGDDEFDRKPSGGVFKRNNNGNTKKPSAFSQYANSKSNDEEEEPASLPARKKPSKKDVDSAADVFGDDDE